MTVPAGAPTKLNFAWSAPAARGSPIEEYKVLALASGGTSQTLCPSVTAAAASCEVEMSVLWASPFSLGAGTLLQVAVQARNGLGWGEVSAFNTAGDSGGVVVKTPPPEAPNLLTVKEESSDTFLFFNWTALDTPAKLGHADSILSYELQWDAGAVPSVFLALAGHVPTAPALLATSHNQTTAITAGLIYRFRVRGVNAFGAGPFSGEIALQAYTRPDPVQASRGDYEFSTVFLGVRVVFTRGAERGGVLLRQEVALADVNGLFHGVSHLCDTDRCSFPQTLLRAAPFSLGYDSPVLLTVQSVSTYGPSETNYTTPLSSAVRVQAEPQAPSGLARDTRAGLQPSHTHISLTWTALTSPAGWGGALFLSGYELFWDKGPAGNGTMVHLTGGPSTSFGVGDQTYTVGPEHGVQTGETYSFQVRAHNQLGTGSFSAPPVAVLAANSPLAPANLSVAKVVSDDGARLFSVSWGLPDKRGANITAYEVKFVRPVSGAEDVLLASCDGSSESVLSSRKCLVPQTELRAAPALL